MNPRLAERLTLAAALLAAPMVMAAEPADHLFVGRNIITMTAGYEAGRERPRALAVRGGEIVWLGDAADAGDWVGPRTTRHELGERALLPGFIDAHGHLTFLAATMGWANLAPPPVGRVTDLATLAEELTRHIQENGVPAGSWVIGFGYDDSLMAERRHPDRRVLDGISRDHPIALLHVSGHLVAANSLALAAAGIDGETKDPAGGHIQRLPGTSEPNGILEETATLPLHPFLTQPRGNPMEDLAGALARYAAYGVTTVQDGAASGPMVSLLEAGADAGLLNLDVVVYPMVRGPVTAALADRRFGAYRKRLKYGGVKLSLDGSPQGKTAYLTRPYHVPPPGKPDDYRGYPTYPDEQVRLLVGGYLGAGIPLLAHANGDAAADQLIDAVAAAATGSDHRTVMIHAQTVREDQLERMAGLGMIPSFFVTHTFFWGDWHRDSVLGPERAARISPTRSAADRGMHFTVHNDAPVVPPDMIRLLWSATTRTTRSGAVLGADQRLTIFEALAAMTRDAAYQYFEEDRKGTLAVGRQADLVVLSANPLRTAPRDLLSLKVVATWSRGERVFQAQESP